MADRTTCRARQVPRDQPSWENWSMAAGDSKRHRAIYFVLLAVALFWISSCGSARTDARAGGVTFLIESTPTNLDPRVGTDAFSAHIDGMIFSSLVGRDERMNIVP